jgi:hypothetical protein
MDDLKELTTAVDNMKLFIHPDSVKVLRKLEEQTVEGFSYEAGLTAVDGGLFFLNVTSKWVHQNFQQAYIDEVDLAQVLEQVEQDQYVQQYVSTPVDQVFVKDPAVVDESKFISTVDEMTDYNLGIKTDLFHTYKEELRPRKFDKKILVYTVDPTIEHQGVIQLSRWIKLAALWEPTDD